MRELSEGWRRLPDNLVRYAVVPLIGVCGAFLLTSAWSSWRIQSTWKRTPAVITGTAGERSVEVTVGNLSDGPRIEVPVHPGHWYSNYAHVTLLENPENPNDRRILHWLAIGDLYRPVLRYGLMIAVLLLFLAALRKARHGRRLTWRGGGWADEDPLYTAPSPAISGITHPSSAWKANLFWGALFGIPLSLCVFLAGPEDDLWGVFLSAIGLLFAGWMAWSAAQTRTTEVLADADGVEQKCVWNVKRARWSEVASVKLIDANEKSSRTGRRSSDNSGGPLWVWRFFDASGRIIFSFSKDMEPGFKMADVVKLAQRSIGQPDSRTK